MLSNVCNPSEGVFSGIDSFFKRGQAMMYLRAKGYRHKEVEGGAEGLLVQFSARKMTRSTFSDVIQSSFFGPSLSGARERELTKKKSKKSWWSGMRRSRS